LLVLQKAEKEMGRGRREIITVLKTSKRGTIKNVS
jgi:hypothetical protein